MYFICGTYGWGDNYDTLSQADDPQTALQMLYRTMVEGVYDHGMICNGKPAPFIAGRYPSNLVGYVKVYRKRTKEYLQWTPVTDIKGFGHKNMKYILNFNGKLTEGIEQSSLNTMTKVCKKWGLI